MADSVVQEYPNYEYSERIKKLLESIQNLKDENYRLTKQADEYKLLLSDVQMQLNSKLHQAEDRISKIQSPFKCLNC